VLSLHAQKKLEVQYNRITINDEQGTKQVFYAEEKEIKTKSEKIYYWYSSNKISKTEGGYSGKLLNGQYTRYYDNKNVAEKGVFKLGLKTDQWKNWTPEGILVKESQWTDGLESGDFVSYDAAGQWDKKGMLINGQLHGAIVSRTSKDSTAVQYYNQGQQISEEEYINSNLFRKSGHYIGDQFNKIFRKEKTPKAE